MKETFDWSKMFFIRDENLTLLNTIHIPVVMQQLLSLYKDFLGTFRVKAQQGLFF